MEQLKNKIKEKRNIKENTLNTYLRNLRVMAKDITGKEYTSLSFLNDFNKVKTYLEKNKPSTKKNKLATILVLLRLNEDKNEKLIEKYLDYLSTISEAYYKEIEKNKKTLKQSENWISGKDLSKIFNHYSREIREEGLNKASKKVLDKREKELLQKYLVVALYTTIPPRRNVYADTKIISEPAFKKLSEQDRDDNNYLVVKSRNKKYFNFGNYKTKRTHGTQKIDIPSKLNSILNIYLKYNDTGDWLLKNKSGGKLSRNGLTKFITKSFSIGKGRGKKIGSSLLRHIYITENIDLKAYRKMKETAEKMGHSVQEQHNYNKED